MDWLTPIKGIKYAADAVATIRKLLSTRKRRPSKDAQIGFDKFTEAAQKSHFGICQALEEHISGSIFPSSIDSEAALLDLENWFCNVRKTAVHNLQDALDGCFFDEREKGEFCFRVILYQPGLGHIQGRAIDDVQDGLFPVGLKPDGARCSLRNEFGEFDGLAIEPTFQDISPVVRAFVSNQCVMVDNVLVYSDLDYRQGKHWGKSIFVHPLYVQPESGIMLRFGAVCIDSNQQDVWRFIGRNEVALRKLLKPYRQTLLLLYAAQCALVSAVGAEHRCEKFRPQVGGES